MENPNQPSMAGCTANVVFRTKNKIICANAGDSRSFIRLSNDVNFFNFKLILGH